MVKFTSEVYKIEEPCPICEATPINVFAASRPVPYIADDDENKTVDIVVIIHQCSNEECGFEWTDYRSELLRDYGVKKARKKD